MLFTSMIIINIRSCSQTYGQWRHGPMASAVARAYNGGLGAEPPAEFRGPW